MRYTGTSLGLALLFAFHPFAPAQLSTSIQIGKPDKPIVGSPYTADQTVTIVRHLPDGIPVTQTVRGRICRSADGVERYEGAYPSTDPAHPGPVTIAYILDRTKHTSITLNSNLKTATRQALPDPAAITVSLLSLPRSTGPESRIKPENPTTVDLGKRNIGMLEIHGKMVTATIPADKIGNSQPLSVTVEMWVAVQEKIIVKQVEKNPLTGERTIELTNIRAEEPDPTLFQIPEGYAVKDRPAIPATIPSQLGSLPSAPKPPEPRTKQIEDALNSPDPIIRNMAVAAEDTRNASVASVYATQLAGIGDEGATRLAASHAAMAVDTAAAAAEEAAAAVESDASQAAKASATGDIEAVKHARDKAATDYSALLAADDRLAKSATALTAAAAGNAAFYAANPGTAAVNDMGAQDSSAAANLLSAAAKGGTAGYSAAAANEAAAIKDANTIVGLDASRTQGFQAVAQAEAEAQSAATAAAAGASASVAARAVATAAMAEATMDGTGNPYAGAVESGAAAVANAASATISAQQAMDGLKTLK